LERIPCDFLDTSTLFFFGLLISLIALPITSFAQPKLRPAQVKVKARAQAAAGDKIDLNTATAAELAQLKGIGPKKAEMIVRDREQNGPFSSPQDLTRIKGIGPKTVSKNLDRITAGAPQAAPTAQPAVKPATRPSPAQLKAKPAQKPRRMPKKKR
jgi:competence protein ComEA